MAGKNFDVFFLWLISPEIILNLGGPKAEKIKKAMSTRTGALVVALSLPTLYVIISNFYELNAIIDNVALQRGMGSIYAETMAFIIEYLVFAVLFLAIIWLEYGFHGLKTHLISPLFLTLIWAIYMMAEISLRSKFWFRLHSPSRRNF